MKILIDEQESSIGVAELHNLGEALMKIQDTVTTADQGKTVIDVSVNGRKLYDYGDDVNTLPINEVDLIEVSTDYLNSTVVRALCEIKDGLPNLVSMMNDIASALQEGNREKALLSFSQTCDEWRKIIQFFDDLALLMQINYSCLKVGDKSVDQANQELLELLVDTKKAIESDDLVMLSDLIEYELAAKIEEEIQIVDVLIEHINSL